MLTSTESPPTGTSRTSAPAIALRARAHIPWRPLIAAALLAIALGLALAGGLAKRHPAVAPAVPHRGLSSLPLVAQGKISAALGADQRAYRASRTEGGFAVFNPAQRLHARFGRSGVRVSSGPTTFGMSLRAVGFGSSLTSVHEVAPTAKANRISYVHPGITEWYANGPLGLEQGFTIPRAPAGHQAGPLTLSIATSGNARAGLAGNAQSLALGHSLSYGGLRATDANGRTLHSWLTLRNDRLLIRVEAQDARYPVRVDPFIQQGSKLTASGESGAGHVGYRVALSADGNTALVGAPFDNGGAGAAWVFTRAGSTWTQQGGKLTGVEEIPGKFGEEFFGRSVALSSDGNTALIGGDWDNEVRGAAWVFTRNGSTWTQQGPKLTGAEAIAGASFGISVALSADGNTALIGAPFDTHGAGAAWVFTRTESTWAQQGEKLIGGEEVNGQEGGRFGSSAALSADGNTALIGGNGDSALEGAAWVFTRSDSTWAQQGKKLRVGNGLGGAEQFGESGALSSDGNTALIGYADGASIFTRVGVTWTYTANLFPAGRHSESAVDSHPVSLSGDGRTALWGGPDDGNLVGAVWVFARSGEQWAQEGTKLTASGEVGSGSFGYGVAIARDGETIMVGGHTDNEGVGAAWAFGRVANSLQAPEYGRCLTVTKGTGLFENANCTKLIGTGAHEWYPAVGGTKPLVKPRFTTRIKELTEAKLYVAGKHVVSCTGETGSGEYSGPKTIANVAITLTGCHLDAVGSCQSLEAAPGEVMLSALEGELGVIATSTEGPLKNKIGTDLKPVSGPVVAAFACASTPVLITGSVIGEVPRNAMKLTTTPKFVASTKGLQKPTRFEGLEEDVLLTKLGEGGAFEQTGLKLTMVQTNEERVEVNSVF